MRLRTLLLLLLVVLLVGCSTGSHFILSGGVHFSNQRVEGGYWWFSGYKKHAVDWEMPSTVVFTGNVKTERGEWEFVVLDSDNKVILSVNDSGSWVKSLDILKSGKYWIQVNGDKHKGRFEVTWEVQSFGTDV